MKLRYSLKDIKEDEEILIYGAGKFGKYILKKINTNQMYGFIDENAQSEQFIDGFVVYSTKILLKESMKLFTYIVAVANPEEKRVITRRLLNLGVDDGRIIIPITDISEEFFQNKTLFYEEYLLAYLKQKLNNIKVCQMLETNCLKKIALIGPESVIKYVNTVIKNSYREINCLDKNELDAVKGNDVVIIGYIYEFNYFHDMVAKLTDAPVINLMEML